MHRETYIFEIVNLTMNADTWIDITGISIDILLNNQTFSELDFSSHVTNQKLFNRYDWHFGRSIVPPFSLSLSLSLSLFLSFLASTPYCSTGRCDDATVVRKRRATEDDRRFRRDKWRVSGGYFDSGTIALGNDHPSSSYGLFSSFFTVPNIVA